SSAGRDRRRSHRRNSSFPHSVRRSQHRTVMSKPKGEQNPTAVVMQAIETASHVDARGRRITVKTLNAMQMYRLAKLLGREATPSSSDMASIAATVCQIDATKIAFPSSERDVEFLLQQLDFDGLFAATEALKKLAPADEAEQKERELAEAEAAKN